MWMTTCSLASSFSIVSFWANIMRIFAWNIGMVPKTRTTKKQVKIFSHLNTDAQLLPTPLHNLWVERVCSWSQCHLSISSQYSIQSQRKHHWTHLQHHNFFFKPRWWRLAMLEVRRATCAITCFPPRTKEKVQTNLFSGGCLSTMSTLASLTTLPTM